jgi:ABC-type transport system substrate-binding protein
MSIITASEAKTLEELKSEYKGSFVFKVFSNKLKPWDSGNHPKSFVLYQNMILGNSVDVTPNYGIENSLLSAIYDPDLDAFVISIPKNLKFQNGRAVNSEDIRFSLLRPLFIKGWFAAGTSLLWAVKGVENVKAGDPYEPEKVTGVKILNERQISVKLRFPSESFLYSLTSSYFSPVPREELMDDLCTWKKYPIGAGDYQVIYNDPHSSRVVLKKVFSGINEKKLNLTNSPKIIIWTAEPEDDADFNYFFAPSVEDKNKTAYISENDQGIAGLWFNWGCEAVKDENFRKFVYYAIDRRNLIKNQYYPVFGITSDFLLDTFWGKTSSINLYDKKKAEHYFSKIPEHILKQEWILTDELLLGPNDMHQRYYTNEIVKELREYGLHVKYVHNLYNGFTLDMKQYIARVQRNTFSAVDPTALLAIYSNRESMQLRFPPFDVKYDQLLRETMEAPSRQQKVQKIKIVSDYMTEEKAYLVPLMDFKKSYLYNAEKVIKINENMPFEFNPAYIEVKIN